MLLAIFLFGLLNLAFLLRFADRDGYEGDDLNSILPMAHLDAAKQGLLLIYRYGWQPLSYEIGAFLWRMFGTPEAVFLSAPIAGALTLALLFWWLWREARGPNSLIIIFVALLAAPELWFSSLYFNSTILGMPMLCLAILLSRGHDGLGSALLAGILMGLAIMTRMDFILVCSLLAVAAWPRGSIARPIAVAAGVVVTLGLGFGIGLLDLQQIIRIQQESTAEITARANEPGWDLRVKLFVISVSLSPVGWLLLLTGTPVLMIHAVRNRDWRCLAWAAAALPAVYPLINMLSPKYMLPLLPFMLLMFVRAQEVADRYLHERLKTPLGSALILAAAVPTLISVSLFGHAPFLYPGLNPARPIGTHDGPRGYGGYVWLMMATDAPGQQTQEQRDARLLATDLNQAPAADTLYLGGENFFDRGAVGWRHLQLALETRGIHGRLIAPHTLLFQLEYGRKLILARQVPSGVSYKFRIIDVRQPNDTAR